MRNFADGRTVTGRLSIIGLEPALLRSYAVQHRFGRATAVPDTAVEGEVDAGAVYQMLQQACETLERAGEFGIAASVSYSMSLVRDKYGVGEDRYDQPLE